MAAPRELVTKLVQFGSIREVTRSPDGKYMFSLGEDDGMLTVSTMDTLDQPDMYNMAMISDSAIKSVCSVPSRASFFFGDGDNNLCAVKWPPEDLSNKISVATTEFDIGMITADPAGTWLCATGPSDTQISVFPVGEIQSDTTAIYDNLTSVTWMGFSPDSRYFVSLNEGNVLIPFRTPDFEPIEEINEVVSSRFAITWSHQNELIVGDGANKGLITVYDFENEPERLRVQSHQGPIVALALSDSGILATADTNGLIVLSKFENRSLALLTAFNSSTENALTTLIWLDSRLCAGANDGSFTLWSSVEAQNMKEIQQVKAVMAESDSEVESLSESEQEERTFVRRLTLKPKHEPMMPKKSKNTKRYEDDDEIPVAIGSDEVDYEEDEEEEAHDRSKFFIDEAEDGGDYETDSEAPGSKKRDSFPFRGKTSEDLFEELKRKYAGNNESESESSESDSYESDREVIAEEKRQRKLDKRFIDDGDDGQSGTSSDAEEEDHIDKLSDDYDYDDNDDRAAPFMPGSSEEWVNKRRFLCWNLMGGIFLREGHEEMLTYLDIEFADRAKYFDRHTPNDNKWIMGTMSTGGIALASRIYLEFKLHKSWAPDSECLIRMSNEETIDLIACGDDWVAAATSKQYLRIYMASGLEVEVQSLPNRALTMVGQGQTLAVFYMSGESIQYKWYNVKKRKMMATGTIPTRLPLLWVGIDANMLYAMGNDYYLYQLVLNFGAHWTPVCNARAHFEDGATGFHCIGVSDGKLCGVFLTEEDPEPATAIYQDIKELPVAPLAVDEDSRDMLSARYRYIHSLDNDEKERNGNRNDKELLRKFASALEMHKDSQASEIGMRIVTERAKNLIVKFARDKGNEEIAEYLENYYIQTAEQVEEEEEEQPDEEQPQEEQEENEAEAEEEPPQEQHEEQVDEPEEEKQAEEEEAAETDEYDDQDSIGEE